jgi:transcription termination/antitermination protein NusA
MAGTIDMQLMRYINLFAKVSRVQTTKCFVYNNQIIFAVPKASVSVAIGKGAVNIKKLSEILRKRIKVVAVPIKENQEGISQFIKEVVDPVEFNKIEVKDKMVNISAGRQGKAALIGRGRAREKELSDILKNFFGVERLRIS